MMPIENLIVGISLVFSGALIIVICLPLLKNKVKPNSIYGIRLAKSFESDENWFKMNRYGAKQMIIWSAAMMVCGLGALFLPLRGNVVLTLIAATIPMLFLIVPIIQICRYSKTL